MTARRQGLFAVLPLVALAIFYLYVRSGAAPRQAGLASYLTQGTGHRGPVRAVRASPDGRYIASGGADSTVRVWNPANGKAYHVLQQPAGVTCLTYNHDGQYLFAAGTDGQITEWQLYSATATRRWPAHSGPVWGLALSPDGATLISCGADKTIRLWNTATGQLQRTFTGHTLAVRSVAFSADSRHLASGSDDATVRIWDLLDSSRNLVLQGHRRAVRSVAFSPGGDRLASGSDDGKVRVWRTANGQTIHDLQARGQQAVHDLAFGPGGSRLVIGTRDQNAGGELWQRFLGNAGLGRGVTVWLYDSESGALLESMRGPADDVDALTMNKDGLIIAAASSDGTLTVWLVKE